MLGNKLRLLLPAALGVSMLWLAGCASTVEPGPERLPRPPGSKPPAQTPSQGKPYQVFGKWYQPLTDATGFKQRGIASWYGEQFHGRKTSNGEIYDMYAMTAAHKTLPLGTWVRVSNLENGNSIEVRVNDRGPFVGDRIIDLTYTGAKALGYIGPGTAQVEVTALGRPETVAGKKTFVPVDYDRGTFTVQVGAFRERANAEKMKEKLSENFQNAHVVDFFDGQATYYRVRVGRCSSLPQAEAYQQTLVDRGYANAVAVAE